MIRERPRVWPHVLKRHKTASALVELFCRDRGVNDSDRQLLLSHVTKHGKWAFAKYPLLPSGKPDTKRRSTIHWWASSKQPTSDIAMMLGHELGHISDRQVRGLVAEEDRADVYGEVAREVFNILRRRRL